MPRHSLISISTQAHIGPLVGPDSHRLQDQGEKSGFSTGDGPGWWWPRSVSPMSYFAGIQYIGPGI